MPATPEGNVIIQRGKTEQVWHSLAEHTCLISAARHVISSHSAAKTPPSILQHPSTSTRNCHVQIGLLMFMPAHPYSYFMHSTQPWPSLAYLQRLNVSDIRRKPTPSPTNATRSSANDSCLWLYTLNYQTEVHS